MKKTSKKMKTYPYRPSEVPVTQGMLYGVRDELMATVNSVRATVNSLAATMNSRFEMTDAKIHRLGVLIEEQNAKNNVVLDDLSNLFHRQERLEDHFEDIQKVIAGRK